MAQIIIEVNALNEEMFTLQMQSQQQAFNQFLNKD
jgi:hypothetical protein